MRGLLDLPPEVLTEILDRLPLLTWPVFSLTCVHLAKIVANHVPGCAAKMGLRPEKTNLETLIAVQRLCYPIYLNEPRQLWHKLTPNYIINYVLFLNPAQGFDILLALEPTREDLWIFHPFTWHGGIHVIRYWVEQLRLEHTLPLKKIMERAIEHGREDTVFYLLDKFPALYTSHPYRHLFLAAQYDQIKVLRHLVEHGLKTKHEAIMVQLLIGRCQHMESHAPAQKDRLDMIMHFVQCLDGKTEELLWKPGKEWDLTRHFLMMCAVHNHVPALHFYMTTFVPFFFKSCASFVIKGRPMEESVARFKTFIVSELLPFTSAKTLSPSRTGGDGAPPAPNKAQPAVLPESEVAHALMGYARQCVPGLKDWPMAMIEPNKLL